MNKPFKDKLQFLVDELKDEREKATKAVEQEGIFGGIEEGLWLGRVSAFSKCIQKLTLLINS